MYLILLLINSPTFPPVASSENPNDATAKCEPDGQDATVNPAEAIMPFLVRAMGQIFGNNAAWVRKRELGQCEGNAMLVLIVLLLLRVPLESGLGH